MKPTLYLRVAAVLTLVHAVLHTIGGVYGKIEPGPATVAVTAMKENAFPLMGHMRTFWDFYHGLGLDATISMGTEALVMWFLSDLAKRDARSVRPITAALLFGYLLLAVNSQRFFFFGPVIVEILIAICLGLSMLPASAKLSSDNYPKQEERRVQA